MKGIIYRKQSKSENYFPEKNSGSIYKLMYLYYILKMGLTICFEIGGAWTILTLQNLLPVLSK
jgi:hypothetical protein